MQMLCWRGSRSRFTLTRCRYGVKLWLINTVSENECADYRFHSRSGVEFLEQWFRSRTPPPPSGSSSTNVIKGLKGFRSTHSAFHTVTLQGGHCIGSCLQCDLLWVSERGGLTFKPKKKWKNDIRRKVKCRLFPRILSLSWGEVGRGGFKVC